MKSFFLPTIVAIFMAGIAAADPWSPFQIATNYRPWGNEENNNMEKAFQRVGLPDDGCWENVKATTVCVISMKRTSEHFRTCNSNWISPMPLNFGDCKDFDQMDYLTLYRIESNGSTASKGSAYICKHPTGTDPWPKELCITANISGKALSDLVEEILTIRPELNKLFQDRKLTQ